MHTDFGVNAALDIVGNINGIPGVTPVRGFAVVG
jgi:hypothetical protein